MTGSARVLVVGDEFLIVEMISIMLSDMGMEMCASASSADEAVALASEHLPDLVLMDVRLKGRKDGVDAAVIIRGTLGTPIIFITGSGEPATIARIRENCPGPVLLKPISVRMLTNEIMRVLGRPVDVPGP